MEEMNFEELRNQYAILKDQLNKQEIVNDCLIRETMRFRKKEINTTKKTAYIAVAAVLLIYPYLYINHIWSLAFIIVTCLMMLFCLVATLYIHRPVDRLNFMRDDFSTVARVMAKFKKQYDNWLHYVAPALIIPWLSWACYEYAFKNSIEGVSPLLLIIPLIVGAVIGGFAGYRLHCKAVNAAQDIIDEIENVEMGE